LANKVTVYIPSYNYGHVLQDAIYSLEMQTHQNWHCIIIDDHSTDNTQNIIKKYKKDDRFTILTNSSNLGLVKCANTAFKLADTDYVVRLDADDTFHRYALNEFDRRIHKLPSKPDIVYCEYYEGEEGDYIYQPWEKALQNEWHCPHGSCTMIKASFMKSIGYYNEKYRCQDGQYLWIKAWENKAVVTIINKPLFYYNRHEGSLSSNQEFINDTKAKLLSEKELY